MYQTNPTIFQKQGGAARRFRTLLLELLIAAAAAFLIELCFNLPSLSGGYAPVALTVDPEAEDGTLVYAQTFEEPVYIKKLILKGTFRRNVTYTVDLTVVNDFGQEEALTITDKAYPRFDAAFTNIGKKVSKIQVTFARPRRLTVETLSYSNEVCFNKFRMLFFALVCFAAMQILFGKGRPGRRAEILYLICALGFGCLFLGLTGCYAVTWDEEVHYQLVCTAAPGSESSWNQAALTNTERQGLSINTYEELLMMNQYMDQLGEEAAETPMTSSFSLKTWVNYFPMILLYRLGGLFGLSYCAQYTLGRLGNLLFCTFLGFLSIRLARRKKLLISVISSMPTVLFQCSMYTYDGFIFSCLTLGFVLILNCLEEQSFGIKIGWKRLLPVLLLFAAGCLAKPVYAPAFLLFLFFLPRKKLRRPAAPEKKLPRAVPAAIFAVLLAAAVFLCLRPLLISLLSSCSASLWGDTRGGDTGVVGQLLSILNHPLAFLKMLIHEVFTMDNFRNLKDLDNSVLIQMFLNLYTRGSLKDAWVLLLLPLLLMLFLADPKGEPVLPAPAALRRIRRLNAAVLLSGVLLIWVAMYLTFTPIGAQGIEGVQARYFLPLFLPAAYMLWNNRIRIQISRNRYFQIAWGCTLLLSSACIYQALIGKCII